MISHITNYPKRNLFRQAQAEMLLEYCSYAGIDLYDGDPLGGWPDMRGLFTRSFYVGGYIPDMTDAWRWVDQIPYDRYSYYTHEIDAKHNRMFYYQGHSYV